MATVWSILTTLALMATGLFFTLTIYPFRSLGDESRKGAGFLLFVSTMLVVIGLRFRAGGP